MKRPQIRLSISSSLILLNTVLIIMTGLTVMFFSFKEMRSSIYAVADNLLSEISKSVLSKTQAYLIPAERAAHSVAWLLWNHRLDMELGPEVLLDYFQDLIQNNDEFKSVYSADTNGNLVMARRMPDGSLSRRYVRRQDDGVYTTWKHSTIAYYSEFNDTHSSLETAYDPRKRLWYKGATEKRGLVWSEVYIFASDRQPGITCSVPHYDSQGTLLGVTAVDISVLDLSYYLGAMQVTENSRLFITDVDDRLIALQMRDQKDIARIFRKKPDKPGYDVLQATDIGDSVLSAVVKAYHQHNDSMAIFRLTDEGRLLHALIRPLTTERGINLRIGVIIPDDDIMATVYRNNYIIIGFSLFMILLAILLSLIVSRLIAHPMLQLSGEMKRIEKLDLGVSQGISTIITEINDIQGSFDGMKTGLQNFRRYVPAELVSQLISQKQAASLGGVSQHLTIFFSDIEGFTTIAERLDPEVLVQNICEYFNVISGIILDEKGTLDKYIGDSVMAFWGAPTELEDHAYHACLAAVIAQERLGHLARLSASRGKPRFLTRIGIHSDEVVVGNIGYEERFNYTVLGNGVNLSSRLEGLNKFYGTRTLVSHTTAALVRDRFEFRRVDRVAVKGKTEGGDVFELLAIKGDMSGNLRKLMDVYENGLAVYYERDWKYALQHFNTVLKYHPGDGPSRVLAARCRRFIEQAPPSTWGLTWEWHSK